MGALRTQEERANKQNDSWSSHVLGSKSHKGRETSILIKMGWRERTRIKVYPAYGPTIPALF